MASKIKAIYKCHQWLSYNHVHFPISQPLLIFKNDVPLFGSVNWNMKISKIQIIFMYFSIDETVCCSSGSFCCIIRATEVMDHSCVPSACQDWRSRTSLVVQWLRLSLPGRYGLDYWLVSEDPICLLAKKPKCETEQSYKHSVKTF